jgi:hypothetical protein
VDLRPGGWHAHGHDRNPAFRNVILHVVWEQETPRAGAPPLLGLRPFLDAPLGELSLWLEAETSGSFPEELRGQCAAPLSGLAPNRLIDLLHQAAQVRLRTKAAWFQARARQAGWEQALWEGLFRALGFKNNIWPMQRLGELRPRWLTHDRQAQLMQARLLGLSGLLPAELTHCRPGTDRYLRCLWDQWWRERDEFSDVVLPRELWRLHGLRPANHPQRRLALAAGWSAMAGLIPRLEQWCVQELTAAQMAHALLSIFQIAPDDYWSWHWTLRSARLRKEQPLLGATRVTDLAVNVVIPWLWIRAVEGKNQEVQTRLEQRYFKWPAAQDNSVLRLARQRLLGGLDRRTLPGAACQQGLIQIVRDFCEHSDPICHQCKLPDLARAAAAAAAASAAGAVAAGASKAVRTDPAAENAKRID